MSQVYFTSHGALQLNFGASLTKRTQASRRIEVPSFLGNANKTDRSASEQRCQNIRDLWRQMAMLMPIYMSRVKTKQLPKQLDLEDDGYMQRVMERVATGTCQISVTT
jgi:hypothetical protein